MRNTISLMLGMLIGIFTMFSLSMLVSQDDIIPDIVIKVAQDKCKNNEGLRTLTPKGRNKQNDFVVSIQCRNDAEFNNLVFSGKESK